MAILEYTKGAALGTTYWEFLPHQQCLTGDKVSYTWDLWVTTISWPYYVCMWGRGVFLGPVLVTVVRESSGWEMQKLNWHPSLHQCSVDILCISWATGSLELLPGNWHAGEFMSQPLHDTEYGFARKDMPLNKQTVWKLAIPKANESWQACADHISCPYQQGNQKDLESYA